MNKCQFHLLLVMFLFISVITLDEIQILSRRVLPEFRRRYAAVQSLLIKLLKIACDCGYTMLSMSLMFSIRLAACASVKKPDTASVGMTISV